MQGRDGIPVLARSDMLPELFLSLLNKSAGRSMSGVATDRQFVWVGTA
jgi:hypothetical protein